MKEKLQNIKNEAIQKLNASDSLTKLNDVRVAILGKKGELTAIMKSMKELLPEERPAFGQLVNEVRAEIEQKLEEAKSALEAKELELRLKNEVIDVTLPAKKNMVGHRHPNTIALEEVERIFIGMGYEVVEIRVLARKWNWITTILKRSISRQTIRRRMNRIHFTSTIISCCVHRPRPCRCG